MNRSLMLASQPLCGRSCCRAWRAGRRVQTLCIATPQKSMPAAAEAPAVQLGPSSAARSQQSVPEEPGLATTDRAASATEATNATVRTLLTRVHNGCRLLVEAGEPQQCLDLLRSSAFLILDAPLPDEELCCRLLRDLAAAGGGTEDVIAALPYVLPTGRVYRAAVRTLVAQRSLRGVRKVWAAARLAGVLAGHESRGLWLDLVDAFGRLGRPAEARAAFKVMRRMAAWTPADTPAANLLLHALHTDVLQLFVRYQQFMAEGVAPDTSTFNVLLKGCMRAKDARRAELARGWMREAGVRGDETTFNTLIKTYSYTGDLERVLGVRGAMAAEGFEPTPRIWGSLLVACGAAKHLEQAAVLWGELKHRHKELLAERAAAAAGGGPLGEPSSSLGPPAAEAAAAAAGDGGVSPGHQHQGDSRGSEVASSSSVASAGAQEGLLTTEVFNAMMTACIDGYQGERALAVFEELRRCSCAAPDLRSFNLAIKGCESPPTRALRPQQLATALVLKEELEAAGLQPDAFTYGTLIDLCARGKQGGTALALYEEMGRRGVPANKTVVSSLFKALGSAGMVDDCMRIFLTVVWGPARVRPHQAMFRHLLDALKENGALGHALSVYQGMREVGYPPRRQEFNELVSAAAELALRQQDTALREQVLALANVQSCREVDLHGCSSTEARAAVLCVLSLAQQQHALAQQAAAEAAARGDPSSAAAAAEPGAVSGWHDITIITGCGKNSTAGEAVLPRVVLKLLREELGIKVDWAFEGSVNGSSGTSNLSSVDGSGSARCSVDSGASSGSESGGEPVRVNAGRIVIPAASLQQWAECKRARGRCEAAAPGQEGSQPAPPVCS